MSLGGGCMGTNAVAVWSVHVYILASALQQALK